eukprot:gene13075-biopygen16994
MVYPKRRIHLPPEAPLTRLRRFVWRSLIKGTLQRFEGVSDGPALQNPACGAAMSSYPSAERLFLCGRCLRRAALHLWRHRGGGQPTSRTTQWVGHGPTGPDRAEQSGQGGAEQSRAEQGGVCLAVLALGASAVCSKGNAAGAGHAFRDDGWNFARTKARRAARPLRLFGLFGGYQNTSFPPMPGPRSPTPLLGTE